MVEGGYTCMHTMCFCINVLRHPKVKKNGKDVMANDTHKGLN